jgi:uncharacterized protein (TIGR03083 family)
MPEHHMHSDKHEAHRRLIARLRQQADDVTRIAAGLDESSLATRTIPDKWSLKELVCHLHRVQQVFEGRIASMLAQDNPAITVYSPDDDEEFEKMLSRPAKDALAAFLEDRERLAAQWEELSPGEWHRSGRHPEYPHYDVHFQVEYMVHHEAHHVYQMFQRRTPFGKMPH